jgi:hypothetical protein
MKDGSRDASVGSGFDWLTMRRRLLRLAPLAFAVLLTGIWLLWPRTAITRENAAKLEVGMTLAAVEAILGGPARDESTGVLAPEMDDTIKDADERLFLATIEVEVFEREAGGDLPDVQRKRLWVSDQVMVRVCHDDGNRVVNIAAMPVQRIRETVADTVRRWFGL